MGIFTSGSIATDFLEVLIAVAVIFVVYFKWTYQYWKRRNVPYLNPSIPFGDMENPMARTVSLGTHIASIYKEVTAKGWKHVGIYLMASPNYMVTDLEYVKNIMTKDFQHFVDRGTYVNEKDDPLSAHLFAIGGTKWRNLRTKMTPTFTSGKIKSMFSTLTNCGKILENVMNEKVVEKQPVDIKSILSCFSTDIIGSCAFGLECNSFVEPISPFREFGQKIFQQSKLTSLKFIFAFNFPATARALGLRQTPKDVSDFFSGVVKDAVKYREKNNVVRKDFLQLMIDLKNNDKENAVTGDGNRLTMDEIAAQSFVFFIAGFETSSTTMTFALFELASHEDIQDKVREEINTVLAKHKGEITYEAINEMKYMGQVIDETLRKYPPAAFVSRCCTQDYKVPDADVIIEKGVRVIIPIRGIHYDERYYPNPNVFDPERFTEENKNKRHPYAHIPFGEGPRICIGMRFGLMQTKVGLTCLLRNFKFSVNEKTQVPLKMSKTSFVSSTEGGVWLNFEKIL